MPKNEDEKLQYTLTYRDSVDILRLVKDSEFCDSLELEFGDMKLSLTRSASGEIPAQPVARISPAARAGARQTPTLAALPSVKPDIDSADEGYARVVAPMLGTFFVAPTPTAPPYVQVGDVVASGDTVGLLEVMKLFTPVTTDVAGRIIRVLAKNGSLVEHGQPLLLIDPLG